MSDLDFAQSLADAADVITLARFGSTTLHIDTKPDHSFVTDADRTVEETLRDLISELRPDDAFLGEESGEKLGGSRQWVIDPIDGTHNYMRGVPVWATLIALVENGVTTAGVVSAPALQRRWFAAANSGAFVRDHRGERRIRVSGITQLADASFSYSDENNWDIEKFQAIKKACWRTRAYGDFWSHMMVAEGVVDFAAEPKLAVWDMAALDIIVREAGGRFTGFNGVDGPGQGSALTSNGHLHDHVLKLLA